MRSSGSPTASGTAASWLTNSADLDKEMDKWRDDFNKYMERKDGTTDTDSIPGSDSVDRVERGSTDKDTK